MAWCRSGTAPSTTSTRTKTKSNPAPRLVVTTRFVMDDGTDESGTASCAGLVLNKEDLLIRIKQSGMGRKELQAVAWYVFDNLPYGKIAEWQKVTQEGARRRVKRGLDKLLKAGIDVKRLE